MRKMSGSTSSTGARAAVSALCACSTDLILPVKHDFKSYKKYNAIIDVGITRVDAPDDPKGYKIVGDTDFDAIVPIAGAITPMPGGVGPMTIAMLMRNTLITVDRSVCNI